MRFYFNNTVPFSVNRVFFLLFLTLLTFQKRKNRNIGKWKLNSSTSCSLGKVSAKSFTLAMKTGGERLLRMCKNLGASKYLNGGVGLVSGMGNQSFSHRYLLLF